MVHRAFEDLCRILSLVVGPNTEDERPEALANWSPERWESVVELASQHVVLPSIAAALTDDPQGIADTCLLAFFQEIHSGNQRRNRDLIDRVHGCCAVANGLGIRPILLKGAAHLTEGLYDDPGARFIADIDILVGRFERDALQQALKAAGYAEIDPENRGASFWEEHHHAMPILDPDGVVAIEVHSDTLKEGGQALDIDHQGIASRALDREKSGVRFRIPAIEDRIIHCLAHHQLGHNDRFVGSIELRDLLDLHALGKHGPCSDEEWAEVVDRFDRAGYGSMVVGFLGALQAMVPEADLGPRAKSGPGASLKKARYLRRHQRSRSNDPTVYAGLAAREWHRLIARKTYRRQLWANLGRPSYWSQRWHNLLKIIWRF